MPWGKKRARTTYRRKTNYNKYYSGYGKYTPRRGRYYRGILTSAINDVDKLNRQFKPIRRVFGGGGAASKAPMVQAVETGASIPMGIVLPAKIPQVIPIHGSVATMESTGSIFDSAGDKARHMNMGRPVWDEQQTAETLSGLSFIPGVPQIPGLSGAGNKLLKYASKVSTPIISKSVKYMTPYLPKIITDNAGARTITKIIRNARNWWRGGDRFGGRTTFRSPQDSPLSRALLRADKNLAKNKQLKKMKLF